MSVKEKRWLLFHLFAIYFAVKILNFSVPMFSVRNVEFQSIRAQHKSLHVNVPSYVDRNRNSELSVEKIRLVHGRIWGLDDK
jgi:hypothetical protein